jgi:hypothetical protein
MRIRPICRPFHPTDCLEVLTLLRPLWVIFDRICGRYLMMSASHQKQPVPGAEPRNWISGRASIYPTRKPFADSWKSGSIEDREHEFTKAVQAFLDTAIAGGHSLESAKAMARDVVARAVRERFKVVASR